MWYNTRAFDANERLCELMKETPLLDTINSIEDFRRIDRNKLPELAAEIRAFLVETVSKTGGHLASNLGVVELTIALHSVFDSPNDALVFDVGHQSYVHKLLTGRRNEFATLRQKGGMSGFPKRSESPHDAFNTGHASTSVSAALGILRANEILGKKGAVVAIIGDGALTGGLSYEALNDAGQSKLPLIVVINDNDMSISHNVGAMSRHLYNMRASASYQRFKGFVADLLHRIPRIGQRLSNSVLRFKNRIKYLLLPNVMFEEMGFTYLGPVDGHDIKAMSHVLFQAKELCHPVVVHMITTKGKGYEFAEKDPEKFHGIGKFDPDTGECIAKKGKSNSEIFAATLSELARRDSTIAAITAAMPTGTGLDLFAREYPERFFDVGIAEEHAVTMAAGMASAGMKPVVAVYSSFLQRAYDEIIHDVCLQDLPVVFAIDRAGLVGEDGETHHGVYDMSFLRNLPNMTVMAPSSQEELRAMLTLALGLGHPCAIRYNRGTLPSIPLDTPVEYGRWETVKEAGGITVIAEGRLVRTALSAAEGLDAAVINARFINPTDTALLDRAAARSKCIITLEDGIVKGGLGSAVAEYLCGKTKLVTLGMPERPVLHASIAQQDEECGISAARVRAEIERAIAEAVK